MTYNTGNPVPSTDPRDLDDNAQALDRLLQSSATQEPDRLGVMRYTWSYVEAAATALVNPNVIALAGLNGQVDRVPYFTGAGALSLAVFTTVARTLMAATTQAAQRAALGLTIGGANGVATLGADGLLPPALLPALAVNDTFVVASQAAQLALTAQRGDVAIRSDLSGAAYILTTDDPTVFANWTPIQQNLGAALQALGALTPAANQLGYFTGTGAAALTSLTSLGRSIIGTSSATTVRNAIGAAASGANGDITSLTGLTTALSVAQGGTGGNTPALARTALGLDGFTSADTAYANNTAYTFTHGLGVVPKTVQLFARCIADEGGYTAGLVLNLNTGIISAGTPANPLGVQCAFNNATLFVRVATGGLAALNYGTGAVFTLTPSSWRLFVKAFA